jgi:hypothetical protein
VLPLTVPPIELPPGALVLRSGAADPQAAALASALEPFGRGDYEDAANRLNALRLARPDDAFVSYYLGVSYLLAGRAADAAQPLQRARELATPGTAMHANATWYLAIVLERSNRVDQVVPLLEQLCGSGGVHDAPACAALVALNPQARGNNRDAASSLLSLAGVGVGGQRAGVGRPTD